MEDQSLPPGFRFHPTDEELITFYLINKVSNISFTCKAIAVVDLNKCEPWDLPYKASLRGEKEWYFFSLKDRKYPTGLRTNRATEAGYWKTTGKDKEIYGAARRNIIGMKKTLVFYKGRAPTGEKSNWVIHEYRLEQSYSHSFKSTREEWVVCRVFQKTVKTMKRPNSPTSSLDCLSENHNSYNTGSEYGGSEQLHSLNPCTNPNPSSSSTQYDLFNSNYEDAASDFIQGGGRNDTIEGMNMLCNWLNPVASSAISGNNRAPLWPISASNIAMSSLILKALQLKNVYRQQQQSMGEAAATTTLEYSSFLKPQIGVGASSVSFNAPLASSSKQVMDQYHGEGQGYDGWGSQLMNGLDD